ncbi:hypothetical protein CC2G_005100 [Coprinopsis cinerea AmutBmut pab1-1]|nr:hypothetical protein CC2G_005100 [Coprinopsis cinerea AmutBmut pab1-1]
MLSTSGHEVELEVIGSRARGAARLRILDQKKKKYLQLYSTDHPSAYLNHRAIIPPPSSSRGSKSRKTRNQSAVTCKAAPKDGLENASRWDMCCQFTGRKFEESGEEIRLLLREPSSEYKNYPLHLLALLSFARTAFKMYMGWAFQVGSRETTSRMVDQGREESRMHSVLCLISPSLHPHCHEASITLQIEYPPSLQGSARSARIDSYQEICNFKDESSNNNLSKSQNELWSVCEIWIQSWEDSAVSPSWILLLISPCLWALGNRVGVGLCLTAPSRSWYSSSSIIASWALSNAQQDSRSNNKVTSKTFQISTGSINSTIILASAF